jgi:DivIVA domain-containing protein
MVNAGRTRFSTTRLRPGYDIVEVDQLIDRIERTIAGRAAPDDLVTAEDVRHVLFSTTRLKPGYDEREVDDALSRFEQQLATLSTDQ